MAVSIKGRIIKIPPLTPDQIAYLEEIEKGAYDPLRLCPICGAPMGVHIIGGPGPYHPRFSGVSI